MHDSFMPLGGMVLILNSSSTLVSLQPILVLAQKIANLARTRSSVMATVPGGGGNPDHLLAKGAAAPVEPVLVMHPDTPIGRDMPRLEATVQPALELTAGPRKRTGFLCQRSTPQVALLIDIPHSCGL